jgi:hypothetical protein
MAAHSTFAAAADGHTFTVVEHVWCGEFVVLERDETGAALVSHGPYYSLAVAEGSARLLAGETPTTAPLLAVA